MKSFRWIVYIWVTGVLACQAIESPRNLTVGEGFVNPLGFHDATPMFSWKLPEGVTKQTAYQLVVEKNGKPVWDSGWVESDQSVLVPYGGEPFASRDRAEWRVRFRDQDGTESDWSDTARFELGLLSNEDWQAQWIRPAQERSQDGEPVAVLRRGFSTEKAIARARIYVTARGLFELTLNGRRVGDDHFANGFTDYNQRLDTLTYDVTGQLRKGDNILDAMLGTGWYAGRLPFKAKKAGPYGRDQELLLQLEIFYEDGSRDTIVSDGQWEGTFEGPIVSSSIYDGEVYDARIKPSCWQPVTANPDLGSARLQPKPFAPVRETQALAVQAITEPEPGRFVFDLGQNMVGWARINVPVEKDQTVTIRFAEMLNQDGTLYTENYRSAKSTDTYTAAKTGTVEWEPHFTFHGFRYVELSGLPDGATPQKEWVTGVVLHTGFRTTGKFESSNEKLNRLQSNITWGWRGNALDIPTDCPQRDERMGWTGDAQVFAATAIFNTGSLAFWKSWLETMRSEQDRDGVIPEIIPSANQRFRNKGPGWMDAATMIPWRLYVRTGDVGLLADNYAMMEGLVGWYRSQTEDGLIRSMKKGYGDWLQPYAQELKGDTDFAMLGNFYYARSVRILAQTAAVLGKPEDAARYAAEADAVAKAIAEYYFDSNGKLQNAPETQTAYVLTIAFDLLPDALKQKAGGHLAKLVHDADVHLRTGFLGTPDIVPVLDRTGHSALAAKLLFTETYPSWFYSINQGATTMWERWNSYSRKDGFGDVSMNSFNHYAYGAIGQWMYERLAGLSPDPENPGYKHFFVRPLIVDQLNYARAQYETPYGLASSGWARKNGQVVLEVVVPPNASATVEFPGGRKPERVSAGTYRFELKM